MKAPLTSEQITRLLGVTVQRAAPASQPKRKRRTTVTPSMAIEIRNTYRKNPTYTWAELGKRFGLSPSAARSAVINEPTQGSPKHRQ
jgi:hypothetical protein